MLAKDFDAVAHANEEISICLQPKLDGHRAVWDGKKLWSRTGKEIVSVPGLLSELTRFFPGIPLDGELFGKEMTFTEITKVCRRTANIEDDPRVKFHIYDSPVEKMSFEDRWTKTQETFLKSPRLRRMELVETVPMVVNLTKVKPRSLNIFRKDYEGTMVRIAEAEYKFGKRSGDLLKIKETKDREAEVVGVQELTTKEKLVVPKGTPGSKKRSDGTYYKDGKETPNNTMGALEMKLPNGKLFKIGSGFSDEQREEMWKKPPIGKTVTFQYQELTDDGIPRFPVFLRFREDV